MKFRLYKSYENGRELSSKEVADTASQPGKLITRDTYKLACFSINQKIIASMQEVKSVEVHSAGINIIGREDGRYQEWWCEYCIEVSA